MGRRFFIKLKIKKYKKKNEKLLYHQRYLTIYWNSHTIKLYLTQKNLIFLLLLLWHNYLLQIIWPNYYYDIIIFYKLYNFILVILFFYYTVQSLIQPSIKKIYNAYY